MYGKADKKNNNSKDTAKERLHLVLMQDRANVSADFLELMRQEIIEVIKKYIDVDESAIDVRMTNRQNDDGTNGAPALYANIQIINIKDETRKNSRTNQYRKIEIKLTEKKNKTEIENKDLELEENNEKKDAPNDNNDQLINQKENEEESIIEEKTEEKDEPKNEEEEKDTANKD
ncbi:cell division topological specificity factor MinE [bacterium]|nr:cell division topological specificity factor MinE [bacterium]